MRAEADGEYMFQVTAGSTSRVALVVSGKEIFNDLAPSQTVAVPSEDNGGTKALERGGNVSSPAAVTVTLAEKRTGSLFLTAGELAPVQLRYTVRITPLNNKTVIFFVLSGSKLLYVLRGEIGNITVVQI